MACSSGTIGTTMRGGCCLRKALSLPFSCWKLSTVPCSVCLIMLRFRRCMSLMRGPRIWNSRTTRCCSASSRQASSQSHRLDHCPSKNGAELARNDKRELFFRNHHALSGDLRAHSSPERARGTCSAAVGRRRSGSRGGTLLSFRSLGGAHAQREGSGGGDARACRPGHPQRRSRYITDPSTVYADGGTNWGRYF